MVLLSRVVGVFMLLCNCMLSSAAAGLWSIRPINSSDLYCNVYGFQYVVSTKLHGLKSVKFSALDKKGHFQLLANSSDCGVWIMRSPSGSVTLNAAYDGCYVSEHDYKNIMTILIERKLVSGKWMPLQTKELKCPKLGDLDHCASVPHKGRIACAPSSVSQDMCTKQGCCFDDKPQINTCYYGNTVTIQCSQEEQMSIAVSKDLTLPPLQLDTIHMTQGSAAMCTPKLITRGLVLFQFSLSACGTTSRERDGVVIYETIVTADIDSVRGRNGKTKELGNSLSLHVHCCADPSAKTAATHLPISPPLDASPEPIALQMRLAKDDLYLQYYVAGDYPVVKLPHDSLLIEVGIVQKTQMNLVLILHQCWATPTEDPYHKLRWPFLVNGCLSTGENLGYGSPTGYHRVIAQSPYKRLTVNMTSVEPSLKTAFGDLVYLHCHASVCVPSAIDPCVSMCRHKSLRLVREATTNKTILVSSNGPVYFPPALGSNISGKGSPVHTKPLDEEWVRIVTVACVFLAILVVICVIKRRYRASNVKKCSCEQRKY